MNKKAKLTISVILVLAIFVVAVWFASQLADNGTLVSFTERFGYLGVTIVAIVAGLNTFVPLPAATFTPVFQAASLSLPLIVFFLALGTLIADLIGFLLGHFSRDLIKDKYPKIFNYITNIQENHQGLIIPVVLIYAAFVPFPNEAILIPLALAGIKFRTLLIPLITGNIIHQAVIIFGVTSILGLFG